MKLSRIFAFFVFVFLTAAANLSISQIVGGTGNGGIDCYSATDESKEGTTIMCGLTSDSPCDYRDGVPATKDPGGKCP